MAVDNEKIKELLGSGLSNDVVASAVGCDPSYVSQLMSNENFRDAVVALRTASLAAASKQDSRINSIEEKLTEKLDHMVDTMYKPSDVLRAFQVLNAAKRRGVPATEAVSNRQAVVNLTLPVQLVQNFITNSNGEVVEVEGQTLVTMPSSQLLRNLSETEKGKANVGASGINKYQKVAAHLPDSALTVERVEG